MAVPANLLPAAPAMDLQDWLGPEQMEPNIIDDLEFAIALSLQEQVSVIFGLMLNLHSSKVLIMIIKLFTVVDYRNS